MKDCLFDQFVLTGPAAVDGRDADTGALGYHTESGVLITHFDDHFARRDPDRLVEARIAGAAGRLDGGFGFGH